MDMERAIALAHDVRELNVLIRIYLVMNDRKVSNTVISAIRKKLRVLGKSDEYIKTFLHGPDPAGWALPE